MDGRRSRGEQEQLKLLGGQFLLLATFVLNLATTFGAVWTIFKLGLNGHDLQGKIFHINHLEPFGDVLSFNADVAAAALIAKDRLGLEQIDNEMISFIASDNTGQHRASISLNPDYISMQAERYGSSQAADGEYLFGIDREVDKLSILGSMENIRSLRSLAESEAGPPNLVINSNEQLELSGNMGVGVHSKRIIVESGDGVFIESKENGLEIRSAPGGLSMPELQVHQEHLEPRFGSYAEEAGVNDILTSQPSKGFFLCICKSDGLVYKSHSSCN